MQLLTGAECPSGNKKTRVGQTPTRSMLIDLRKFGVIPYVRTDRKADNATGEKLHEGTLAPQMRVLIVDDSQVLRERLAGMLGRISGLSVVGLSQSFSEARQSIRELRPDLVILDLQLGDGSGIDILRETKLKDPSIRFIVFTNQSELQYRLRCEDLGADYFLCKSTEVKSLVAISERLVANAGQN